MITKRTILFASVLLLGSVMVFGQEVQPGGLPSELPRGLDVDVSLNVSLFGLEKNDKSDIFLRKRAGDFKPLMLYGPGARDGEWIADAGFSVNYNGGFFGGTLGMGTTTLHGRAREVQDTGKFTALKAWIMPFGDMFRFTAGTGIGSDYADSLGANPGMRIYNGADQNSWDADRNPDNITQDNGVLLEGFFGQLSLALAARYYNPTVYPLNLNPNTPAVIPGTDEDFRNTEWTYQDGVEYSFGGRAGYAIEDVGKFNVSYIIEFTNFFGTEQNFYGIDRDNNPVPLFPNSQTTRHLFGVYASLKPMANVEVTLGYDGIAAKYLDEFYSLTQNRMLETAMPLVYQQAVNVNLRYTGIDRWTFRTDHNVSFWTDKNYRIFGTAIGDRGLVAASAVEGLADVNHLLVWNGLGVTWQFTDAWKIQLYVRNLYRTDTAQGMVEANAAEEDFRFFRNETKGEIRGSWQPNPNLEFYTGLEMKNQITIISKNVHQRMVGERFPHGFVSPNAVKDTRDSTFTCKIPVGIIVRMR